MLDIKAISKSYEKNGVKAVDKLSLRAENGEILGLLGPNGAGKTTTLKMITGILRPDEGDVEINGHSITTDALAAKREFAFVPDEQDAFLRLKGVEYLKFIADVYEVPQEGREEKVSHLARTFEMEAALGDRLSSYSHGMRQKIVLIGALLHNPPLWILDEPMVGLDPKASFELKNRMREHADSGHMVLFSTHVLDVAEKICDRIAIIDGGKLLFVGTLAEMREHFAANSSLESMFLEMTERSDTAAADEA
ncbi:MAG: ABC transporter ATP-binding protein [Clostridiales bacterium]|nr:ABC transporter ATP-binding protein [Clostridiales bacterium]MDD7432001.1 ABC transporter ATP-binding protein [Clostridiales bacterium]MDY3060986.1 ABC transporter ATP-binding protein [Eubacteriales bacterium]